MKIYAAKTCEAGEENIDKLWELLDSDRQKKVSTLKIAREKERSITAGLLLRFAFLEAGYSEQEWQQVRIEQEAHGKPYLKGYDDFHYSLSHSGRWIICVVDHVPVGCDIQEMEPWKLQIAKRFYSREEYDRLLAIEDSDYAGRTKQFYQMWAAKESVVKLSGRGIGQGIDQYVTDADFGFVRDMETGQKIPIRLYDEIEGYAVCVCSEAGTFPDQITRVDYDIYQMEGR